MINYNNKRIIGVDMGYGNMKTAHLCFPTGLIVHDSRPVFNGKILHFKDKYYKIGEGHKPFIADKTADGDFYILTLAAVAAECLANNITEGDIIIAAGIPVSWVKAQRDELRDYIMQNNSVEFTYNDHLFRLNIAGCYAFPQGYPALIDRLNEMNGMNMLADIGNGTMNILYISDRHADESKSYTEKLGVNQLIISVQNAIMDNTGKKIEPSIIENYFRNGKTYISEKYISLIDNAAKKYCADIFNTLHKYDYEPDFMKLYIVGGGGNIVKRFGTYNTESVIFIDDICAAAKGFEKTALLKMRSEESRDKAV